MYLKNDGFSGYNRSGEQIRQRGLFLMLVEPPYKYGKSSIRAKMVVRKVAMQQFGHWMMGKARIYGHSITVSGSYGGDGLFCTVPQSVFDRLTIELPDDLYEKWNEGGGHNSAGSEATSMRQFALEHLTELQK